jgi:Tfp pilus assembly protein FimT
MAVSLSKEEGVTLIELVIVFTIIAILTVIAVSVGPEFIRNENIARVSRELLGDLQRARQDAMTRSEAANSRGFGIRFENPTRYVIFEFSDTVALAFQYNGVAEEANTTTRNLTSSIELQFNGADPNNDVRIYDKLGVPRDNTWSSVTNTTIVVRHETEPAREKCVVISPNRIREGLWVGGNCELQ